MPGNIRPSIFALSSFSSKHAIKVSKDMAAFVELTITTSDGTPVSVVSLMPEEKTYNTSALSTKSNAFGGSAVFKILTVGYSERRRGQTFYLYQDADTLTYRKPTQDGSLSNVKPTFGWFREQSYPSS